MSSDPDWWARGVAGLGTGLGGLSLYLTQANGRWKRRHVAMAPLEAPLRLLESPVKNRQDPQVVQALFTAKAGAALEELEQAAEKVPDRQFRGWLSRLVDALRAVRGGAQAHASTSTGRQPLNKGQVQKLAEADQLLAKVSARLTKAARKGAG